jgi:hypothetical protein
LIYLSRPIWRTDSLIPRWGIPDFAAHARDLRSLAECKPKGNRDGDRSGLSLYIGPDDPAAVKDDAAVPLGSMTDRITAEQKTLLGVSDVNTIGEAIAAKILYSNSPPTLLRGGRSEVKLGTEKIEIQMGPGLPGWAQVQARMKADILAAPEEKQAALITTKLRSLAVPITREKAHEYLDLNREPGPDETNKGDTFNRGTDVAITSHTSTGPNGGDSYTTLTGSSMRVDNGGASGRAYVSGGLTEARLNGDMSSTDFECSFNTQFLSAIAGRYIGAMIRKDSSSTRTFIAAFFSPDRSPAKHTITKCITGTYSDLATVNGTFTADVYKNLKIRGVGNDFTLYENHLSVLTVNDGSVSSGTRGGMIGGSSSGTNFITMQQLLITDELSGSGAFVDRRIIRGVNRGIMRGVA